MVKLKTPRDIAVLREAGRVVAEALAAVRERAEVGITLAELDRVAAKVIDKAAATPRVPRLPPVVGTDRRSRGDLRQYQRRRCPRHPRPRLAWRRATW